MGGRVACEAHARCDCGVGPVSQCQNVSGGGILSNREIFAHPRCYGLFSVLVLTLVCGDVTYSAGESGASRSWST